jgi:hypothetical protein
VPSRQPLLPAQPALDAPTAAGTYPLVTSIRRDRPSPTNDAVVSWTVTFSEPVQGLDRSDFLLLVTGLRGNPKLGTISPGAGKLRTSVTISATTGRGEGMLGLNVVDGDTITDAAGSPLGGVGEQNGDFTGPVYAIDHEPPPAPVLTTFPANLSSDPAPTFAFADVAIDIDHFECRLDDGSFAVCASGLSLAGLLPGEHVFEVRAVDAAGNASAPTAYRWQIALSPGAPPSTGVGSLPRPIVGWQPYTIAGTVTSDLYPGAVAPIAIAFDSPNSGTGFNGTPVTNLAVTISSVTGGAPGPNPCTPADFAVIPIPAGAYPFFVPFGSSDLASLIGAGNLPKLKMLDRADAVPGDGTGNQDACRGADVHLAFTGSS